MSDVQLVGVLLSLLFVSMASFWSDLWPDQYALYLHTFDFLLLCMEILSGTRCTMLQNCVDCTVFTSGHQLVFVPRLVVMLFDHRVVQFVFYGALYLLSSAMVVHILICSHNANRALVSDVSQRPLEAPPTLLARPASPRPASPRPASPRPASPQPVSPRSDSPSMYHRPAPPPPSPRPSETNDDEGDACVICLEPLLRKEVYALPCAHLFHEECVVRWLEREMRCPICNYSLEFTSDDTV